MIFVDRIGKFVIGNLYGPYCRDFLDGHLVDYDSETRKKDKQIRAKLRAEPEYIIPLLDSMPETKRKVFNRLKLFGGVKWYKYLDMNTPIIKWVNHNLEMIEGETNDNW